MSNSPDASTSHVSEKRVLLDISSTVPMLKLVDAVTEHFGRIAGLDEDGVHGLGVAVREAVVNGIKHGNECDERKRVRIEYAVVHNAVQRRVVVRVLDEGHGFEIEGLADPLAPENVGLTSGRGILLVRSFMDDVEVRRVPGGGTEITMTKAIQGASSPH